MLIELSNSNEKNSKKKNYEDDELKK